MNELKKRDRQDLMMQLSMVAIGAAFFCFVLFSAFAGAPK